MSRILTLISLLISFFGGNKYKVLLVPHNDIYQPKIMEFFDTNYQSNVKTIVILGTNHRDVGPPIFQSSDDYSIQNIIPVIKRIYPTAEIISYIIRPSHDIPKVLSFSSFLKKSYPPKNTLFIASVDFSHYTSRSQADTFDRETIDVIKKRDYNQLIEWGPEHTDCPDCLIISSDLNPTFTLTNKEYLEGTSYFFGIFN